MPKQKHYSRTNDNYQGKVSYYQAALSNAVDRIDMEKIKFFTGKLEYFVTRQKDLIGNTESDLVILER